MSLLSFVLMLAQKSWQPAEDVRNTTPKERSLKSVSFQELVSVITDTPETMELESQHIQHGCLSSNSNQPAPSAVKVETPDSEIVQVG